ncbi:hypothetical protein [Rhizobium sp. 007]|uniref:hypothetical protein n=1 Tax=Rhizobium sp. 007 TaxID=2785056 RepID=UPI00188F6C23|nr:hypothetical protein [Rhizobium sp. 007]QPB24570.1 hypothetical protein ISN39_34115 [Rhizobium sp. 007]
MEQDKGGFEIIERSEAGNLGGNELNARILEVWQEMLDEPGGRAQVAAVLGVKESELDPAKPPVSAADGPSGAIISTVIISAVTAFVVGAAGAAGKQAGDVAGKAATEALVAAIRDFWNSRMRRKVTPPGTNDLGRARDDEA